MPSSSSLWKHWKLVCRRDATRATCSRDRGKDPLVLQVDGPNLIGSPRHDLLGGKDAVCDQPPDAMMRNPERRSGLGHREPFAVLLGRTVGVNAVHPAHRADTVRSPSLALTRCIPIRFSVAAISASDQRVAMLRITASAASGVRHPCSPERGLRTRSCEC